MAYGACFHFPDPDLEEMRRIVLELAKLDARRPDSAAVRRLVKEARKVAAGSRTHRLS